MPTDFEPERPRPQRRWLPLLVIAAIFVAAIALATRQVDRTTAVAPDKAPSEKTIGLAPQKTK
jgi:hypothetical protein